MGIGGRMKVRQIVLPIERYFAYKMKIEREKNILRWELLNTGETEKTDKMKQQIAIDEEKLGNLLDMNV